MDTSQRYILVVTCVVLGRDRNDKVRALILKRSEKEKEGPGFWTIPGGKVSSEDWEKGHKNTYSHVIWTGVLERAIKREITEEIGIAVLNIHPLPGRENVFLRKDGTPTLVMVFCAQCSPRARVKLGKESIAYEWIRHADLKRYLFIGNVQDDIAFAFKVLKV